LSAAFEWRALDDLTLTVAAGAALDGEVRLAGTRHAIGPGPVGSLGVAYRLLAGEGWEPFLLLGGSLSATTAMDDRAARLTAVDLRASLTVGEVFLDHLAPYLALRGFGGPIFWQIDGAAVVGSDRTHVQVAAGALVTTGRVDAFFEVAPLGERAFTTGLAAAF
jgi:hypothetical protein